MLLLVCIAPASSSVTFEQGGSSKGPFDVSGNILYKVSVTNSGASTASYVVELKAGPDSRDSSATFSPSPSRIFVDPGSTATVQFQVSFLSPELNRGEFGNWSGDRNDTSTWDRAWYRATIKPAFGDPAVMEDYSGQPELVKRFFEYKKASVAPKQGTNKNSYTYELTALGSYRDNITLQIGPSADGPWENQSTQEYSKPGMSRTLRWENVTLGFDFLKAYYRFRGVKDSKVFEGPFWPVYMNYSNASVAPIKGLSSTPFIYGLRLNASKAIDVGLNVFDINSKTFSMAGRLGYTNISTWQLLEWPGIVPSDISGSEGSSFYYFTFYYPGSDAPFASTYDGTGSYYRGPEIVMVNFNNSTVSPNNGSSLTPYCYCVDVDTDLPVCDIDLQTSSSGAPIWRSQGIATYDGKSKRMCWDDVVLDSSVKGQMRYRFIKVGSTPEEYAGPSIGIMNISATVEPARGSLYITTPLDGAISKVYTFTYSVSLTDIQKREPAEVTLEIYDPAAGAWINAGSRTIDPNMDHLNYTVNFAKLPFKGPFLGESKYRFRSMNRLLGEFNGPAIDVNMINESHVEVGSGSKLTYSVVVRSSQKKIPIALAYTSDNNNWRISDTRLYESNSQEWKTLVWKEYPRYYSYEFQAVRN